MGELAGGGDGGGEAWLVVLRCALAGEAWVVVGWLTQNRKCKPQRLRNGISCCACLGLVHAKMFSVCACKAR